jgi:hypothetical protein
MAEIVQCPDCGRPRADGHPCPNCSLSAGLPPVSYAAQGVAIRQSRSRMSPLRIAIGITVLFVLAFAGVFGLHLYNQAHSGTISAGGRYVDRDAGFSFRPPTSWAKMDRVSQTGNDKVLPVGQAAFGDPSGAQNGGLAVDLMIIGAVKGNVDLSEADSARVLPLIKQYISMLSTQAGLTLIGEPADFVTEGGIRGIQATFKGTAQGLAVLGTMYVVPSGKMLCVMCGQAVQEHWQADRLKFDAAAQSLQITGG